MSQRVQVGGESIVVGGEKVEVPVGDEDDVLCITPLGAGNEVGRSCIVLSFKGKNIMVRYTFMLHPVSCSPASSRSSVYSCMSTPPPPPPPSLA